MIRAAWTKENGKLKLHVNVPPNATALVRFPASNASSVQEKSGYAQKIGKQNGYALFELPAGNFELSEQ